MPRPEEPQVLARSRVCRSCARRSPRRPSATAASTAQRGQVLVTNGGKHAVFTAFATLCDPGDEVICPAPYWTTYPEAITLAGGVPVVVETDESTGFKVTVEQLDAGADAAHQGAAVRQSRQPERRGVLAGGGRGDRTSGRSRTASGCSPTRSTSTSSTATTSSSSMPTVVPELADQCIIVNGVAKTYAMTGWRVGWMIGPNGRDEGGDQLPVARHVQRQQRRPARPRSRRSAATCRAVAMMRDAFSRRAIADAPDAQRDPRRHVHRAQGAFYCYPNLTSLLGRPLGPKGSVATNTLELADIILGEAKVAFVPGEAFGTPGYARFSFAMGDDRHGRGHPPHRRVRRQLTLDAAGEAVRVALTAPSAHDRGDTDRRTLRPAGQLHQRA